MILLADIFRNHSKPFKILRTNAIEFRRFGAQILIDFLGYRR